MAKKRVSMDDVGHADLVNNPKTKRTRTKVSETICTRVTPEIKEQLEDKAFDLDISLSKYVEKILKEHCIG